MNYLHRQFKGILPTLQHAYYNCTHINVIVVYENKNIAVGNSICIMGKQSIEWNECEKITEKEFEEAFNRVLKKLN